MGLDDFEKLSDIDNNVDENEEKDFIEHFDMKDVTYFLFHSDELINLVKDSHINYVNSKIKYENKKNKLTNNIDWSEENALRENHGLPKCTNQTQKDSVINLKVNDLYVEMKNCELKYKNYNKLFDFINNNFTYLYDIVEWVEISSDEPKNVENKQ